MINLFNTSPALSSSPSGTSNLKVSSAIIKDNVNNYINLSYFSLQPIAEVYKRFNSGEEIYFPDLENKPVKIKSITKENYDGQIYDDHPGEGDSHGNWADERKLEIQSEVIISLPVDNVNFGSLTMDATDNTTDNSPLPFEIQNDGNCLLNISLNATDLWASIFGSSSYYQYKFDNKTGEAGSFNWAQTQTDWAQVPNSTQLAMVELNWSDATDSAEIDLLVSVPPQELAGDKSSTLHFTAKLGE